jgi:outer membrane cobalamin receptor
MKPLILILLLSFLVTRSTPGRAAEVETITVYGNRESDSSEEKREFESLTVPIEVRGGESLGDKLRVIPSIDVRESGGEGATPNLFIRGQDPKQTRFFLEGFPLADAEFNGGRRVGGLNQF